MCHVTLKSFTGFLFVWFVFGPANSSGVEKIRNDDPYDFIEKLTEDLEDFKNERLLFVFDHGFYRRNTYAVTKYSLTTIFDVSSLANSYKVQLAVFKFPGREKVTDLTMAEESSSDVTWNTQELSVKNTNSTQLYDISLVLDEWKHEGKNPDKLFIKFNISNHMSKESRKQVLRKWGATTKDGKRLQKGPVFLIVYTKASVNSGLLTRPNPSVNESLANKLRSGTPPSCKLYFFERTFTQLGLTTYVSPKGRVNIGVCYGPCSPTISVDSRVKYMSTHAWILELARARLDPPNLTLAARLQSTCVATGYNGLMVTKKLPNGDFVREHIPDFSASSCGCR